VFQTPNFPTKMGQHFQVLMVIHQKLAKEFIRILSK
jgi:hypothetical protein